VKTTMTHITCKKELSVAVAYPDMGERVKADRRNARKLQQLFRAGQLTKVHPQTPPH